ncbi:MAG TPA: hypothetical protein VMW80_12655 [Candidatus Dormibacteraeota bacterium]|nr:hypothetical protein [Candidatus Dormibacteraeota bacterium]
MPDDYLTVDEVAAQLALPLEMIQRRIESGDIPVHWVEIGGKLEMRISASEIGVDDPGRVPTPFPTPEGFVPSEAGAETDDEVAPSSWSVRESQYPSDVWTPAEGEAPAPSAPATPTPWEAEVEAEGDDVPAAVAEPAEESPAEPVWRPDPGTWEDEPLDATAVDDTTPDLTPFSPPPTDAYFPLEEAQADFPAPPLPAATGPFTSPTETSESADEDEEEAPFGSDDDDDDEIVAVEVGLDLESPLPSEVMGVPELVEVPRPSALAAAQGPDSALAINSIDARELVAGLFERWERALEQRIQAEQRLRFEAELERRLRQVRDLRQELENTRKSTAAQLAEREQEVLALRNRLREQGPAQPKSRGLFRR